MNSAAHADQNLRSVEMVVPSLEIGGMERMVCRLAEGLRQRGWRVGVTCTERLGALGPALDAGGVPVQVAPAPGVRSWFSAPHLARGLMARAPAIVHTHSGVWLRGVRGARQAGIRRLVHTVHGLLAREPWYGPLEKRIAGRFTARVVGVSGSLVEYLEATVRIPPARLRCIPNGVPAGQYRPGSGSGTYRRTIGVPPGGLVFGTVARLDPIKNLGLLLRAFARLYRQDARHRLVIAGDGPEAAGLRAEVSRLGLQAAVLLPGHVDDAPGLYGDLDVFVLPSLSEGMSLSLQEAMATGVACVATDVGGNREVLDDGRAGLIVPSNDVDHLHDALRLLADEEGRRAALGLAGRQHVLARFSVDRMVDAYAALYDELIPEIIPGRSARGEE